MFAALYAYFYVMNDFGFPADLLLGLMLKEGCKPAEADKYDPADSYKGNTNKRNSPDCGGDLPRWATGADSKYDLRVWYYSHINDSEWGVCESPDHESSVYSGASYCYGTEALVAAQGAFFCGILTTQLFSALVNNWRIRNSQQDVTRKLGYWVMMEKTVLGVLMVYVPGLNAVLGCRPLPPLQLFLPAALFYLTFFVFDTGRRLIRRVHTEKIGLPCELEKVSQY